MEFHSYDMLCKGIAMAIGNKNIQRLFKAKLIRGPMKKIGAKNITRKMLKNITKKYHTDKT